MLHRAALNGTHAQVCVGATCPEERLHLLLPLLEPSGGKLLAPVDNDLRVYTRTPDGKLRQRVVSSVRFSDLEVRCAGDPQNKQPMLGCKQNR